MENNSTSKINVAFIAELCALKGIRHAVISPGSRNAPLIVAFNRCRQIKCHVIVDERSAAFYALGISRQTNEPVVLVCTSGTALLNYSPAIAEAYYQKVPLIVLSADRPVEWIDQDDSQTIRQKNALSNFVKASYELNVEDETEKGIWLANRQLNDAINFAVSARKGPVHLNIPLDEPLCGVSPKMDMKPRVISLSSTKKAIDSEELEQLVSAISNSKKVMILATVQQPSMRINKSLGKLAELNNVIVLTETVSNISNDSFITTIDRDLCRISPELEPEFMPDILINFGGPVISKFLKSMIRRNMPAENWRIGENEMTIDTFKSLNKVIDINPEDFFEIISDKCSNNKSQYKSLWERLDSYATLMHDKYVGQVEWSDLKVFSIIMDKIPSESILHLSNGTSIRYNQLFKKSGLKRVDGNRGTSGIDGATSTAAGASAVFDGITTLITGDTSFFYDSNGLWNKDLSKNFKIIVLNNGGGGIFRFINGPSQLPELKEFFETPHNLDVEKAASLYGLEYLSATNEEELTDALNKLYNNGRCSILDVKTPTEINDIVLRKYFK